MSHADKIKQLLNDGQYHCAKELEEISWSKHKRLKDAEQKYGIQIEDRACVHGIRGAHDYRIKDWQPPRQYRPMTEEELAQAKQTSLFA